MIFVFIANQGFNFFSYNFAYLELVPKVMCKYTESDQFVECDDYKDICEEGKVYEWQVDYNDPFSYHNWMTEQNLFCKNDFLIGSFGSCYFIGFGFMGILLKFSDNYGRKSLAIFTCLYQVVLIFAILY